MPLISNFLSYPYAHFRAGFMIFMMLLTGMARLQAVPANDHCANAYFIKNVKNWCSSPKQFTNYAATPSAVENPGCFPSFLMDADHDVWFKFTAVATTVNISVIGAIKNNPGGTLQLPQLALYKGGCSGKMREIACISDAQGNNIVETFIGNLIVGEAYFIRVDGRNNRTGTFQLCVNNFNPVPSPSSDCSTAVVLCDKSSFTVPSVTSAGQNRRELPLSCCVPEESQSVWYKWTCDKPGTLTFTLKPVNPSDDLDFVLFQLPGGVNDCSSKTLVRCMAAGENVGQSYLEWIRCSGATGLSSKSGDVVENQGCEDVNDNFLAPLSMEAGKSYALMVNNYHNTGNGFTIDFGGSGTFVGPVAHFTVSKLQIEKDQKLTIKNASTFSGGIKKWEWNFGVGATPQTAKGQGPHTVSYNSTGKKSISLSIETGNGCQVTKVRTVEVTHTPPPPPKPEPKPEPPAEPARQSAPQPEPKPEPPPPPAAPEPLAIEEMAVNNGPATTPPPPTPAKAEEQEEEVEINPDPKRPDTTQIVVEYLVKYDAVIYFKSDSSSLEEKDYETLQEVLKILQASPKLTAMVEGHTNNIPSDDYCLKLATARANTVIQWFRSMGIAENRLNRKVFGKKKVVTKDFSLQNRRLNQRVVIRLIERVE